MDSRQEAESLVVRFEHWLESCRGARPATRVVYLRVAARFVSALGGDPAHYSAESVRGFISAEALAHGDGYARHTVTGTRAFLRYLGLTGLVDGQLADAVPAVACWRLAALPRFISWADVERLLQAVDCSSAGGRRDRAILMLLAHLALRAGDVAGMRLEQLDFEAGCLRLGGKGRRDGVLPLPQAVGDALLDYLERTRPDSAAREVFLSLRAGTPLTSSGISAVVAKAIRRAGLQTPTRGAHLLRHSAATQMLRRGCSLSAIAAVLRHASVETTGYYAKVDARALRAIALPWPEVLQ